MGAEVPYNLGYLMDAPTSREFNMHHEELVPECKTISVQISYNSEPICRPRITPSQYTGHKVSRLEGMMHD